MQAIEQSATYRVECVDIEPKTYKNDSQTCFSDDNRDKAQRIALTRDPDALQTNWKIASPHVRLLLSSLLNFGTADLKLKLHNFSLSHLIT
jgi:hypothetical protein